MQFYANEIEQFKTHLETELFAYSNDEKLVSRTCFAAEELLLLYRDFYDGENFRASFDVEKSVKKFSVKFSIAGAQASPEQLQEQSQIHIFDRITSSMGWQATYTYANGVNVVEITFAKFTQFLDNLKFAVSRMAKEKRTVWIAFACQIISVIANFVIPILTAQLIVAYTDNLLYQVLVTAAALLVARAIYSIAFRIASIKYTEASFLLQKTLRLLLARNIFSIRNENFEEHGSGTFVQRLTDDVDTASAGIQTMLDLSSELLYYAGVMIATLILNVWIFLGEVITLAVLFVLERKRANELDTETRKVNRSSDVASNQIVEMVSGVTDVKLLDGIDFFTGRLRSALQRSASDRIHADTTTKKRMLVADIVNALLYFVLMCCLGVFLYEGMIDAPVALILFNYLTIIGQPLISVIQRAVTFVKEFNLACERIRNLIEGSEFSRESPGSREVESLAGNIEFKNVTFAYNHDDIEAPDFNILEDVNLKINAGEMVAFVGKSGCGKSTLLSLLARQRACYCGSVLIDGYDVSTLTNDSLRKNVAVVAQAPFMFNMSITDNLLLAKPNASMEELAAVCARACVLEDVQKTEHGFDTMLGEKGTRLSGGQKQRLAIARALLMDAPILLLDEATSAIDNLAQERIMHELSSTREGRTIIMVAHRLSTIKNADRIVLLADKRIRAIGTHEELMTTCEDYRNLFNAEDH